MALNFKVKKPSVAVVEEVPEQVVLVTPNTITKEGVLTFTDVTGQVDVLADLDMKIKKLKKTLEGLVYQYGVVLEKVSEPAQDAAPEAKISIYGNKHICLLGPQANVSTVVVDTRDLQEMIGDEIFYNVCKLGITDLRKYLTPSELEQVLTTSPIGKRTVKIQEK